MDIQAKLSKFYKMVISEANKKNFDEFADDCNKIREEIKNYFDNLYIDMIERINVEKLKLCNQTDKFLALKILETKKELLLKRLDLKRMFFVELKRKIIDFVETDDYQNQILNELNNFNPKRYKFKDFIFEFSERDKNLVSVIKNNFEFEILISKEDFIGGYKIYANNYKALLDKTFQCRLEKLKEQFNKFNLESIYTKRNEEIKVN